jgi:dodecin
MTMPDHVYRIIQVAGSSEKSIEDAIQNAVGRASSTLRQVGWFEVIETRGHVEDGRVAHYQVTLKGDLHSTTIDAGTRGSTGG